MNNQTNQQDQPETGPIHHGASITGHDKEPLHSDDTTAEYAAKDNLHTEQQENSANGLDSIEIRGGQNGRNIRGMGSQDMDSANGVLRFNDQDDTTMHVTEAAKNSAAASSAQTDTSLTGTTTIQAGSTVSVPNAQQMAAGEPDEEADKTAADSDDEADMTDEIEEARRASWGMPTKDEEMTEENTNSSSTLEEARVGTFVM